MALDVTVETDGPERVDEVAAKVRSAFLELGAMRVSTPAVQPIGPYLDFLGEDYRQRIVPYDADGAEGYCLRPDYTLALALELCSDRLTFENYVYDDFVFRGDQISALHEAVHRQVGVEMFNFGDAIALETRLINAARSAASACGVRRVIIKFADVGLVNDLIESLPLHAVRKSAIRRSFASQERFQRAVEGARSTLTEPTALGMALAGMERKEALAAVEEIFSIANVAVIGTRDAADIADRMVRKAHEAAMGLTDGQVDAVLAIASVSGPVGAALETIGAHMASLGLDIADRGARWTALMAELAAAGFDAADAEFDADLGRGFSYYDGLVFELVDADSGAVLGGGGRYDSLAARLSGGKLDRPAIGAALRPDRLAAAGGAR